MLYTVVRIVFVSILFGISLIVIQKRGKAHLWRWRALSFGLALLLLRVLNAYPVENAFWTFKSPQAVATYCNLGEVELVVQGGETDFITTHLEDNKYPMCILPKTDKGWKIGMKNEVRSDLAGQGEHLSFFVLQYKGSDEYYVSIYTGEEPAEITDSRGSTFYQFESLNADGTSAGFYACAYVPDLDESYSMTVNGETLTAGETQAQ